MKPPVNCYHYVLNSAWLLVLVGTIGCQAHYGGHMGGGLPRDEKGNFRDVEVFPEFNLANEAAAMKAVAEENAAAQANSSAEVATPNAQR